MDPLLAEICGLLFKLGLSLVFGFYTFRFNLVTEKQGLSFMAGRVGLPLLAFKAIVTADVNNLRIGVVLSCAGGKACVYALALLVCFCVLRRKTFDEFLISGSIFSFHVTAANDFVFGLPIIKAFFPENGLTQLAANVLVQNLVFQTMSLALLAVGGAQKKRRDRPDASIESKEDARRKLFRALRQQLLQDPLICALICAVVYKACTLVFFPHIPASQSLPWLLSETIDFFTSPFCMVALFLTGANVAGAFNAIEAMDSGVKDDDLAYYVGIPVALVLAKNIICPFVTLIIASAIVPTGVDHWHDFAFLYGLIPTSSAPMLVAMRVGYHVEVVAVAVCIGIIVAVPMLIAYTSLFGDPSVEAVVADISAVQIWMSGMSAVASALVLIFTSVMRKYDEEWRKYPLALFRWYALSCFFYSVATLVDDATSCKSTVLLCVHAFFELQCHTWHALMLLQCVIKQSNAKLACVSAPIAWLVPILPCLWVALRPDRARIACEHIGQNDNEFALHHAYIETLSLFALLLVGGFGICIRCCDRSKHTINGPASASQLVGSNSSDGDEHHMRCCCSRGSCLLLKHAVRTPIALNNSSREAMILSKSAAGTEAVLSIVTDTSLPRVQSTNGFPFVEFEPDSPTNSKYHRQYSSDCSGDGGTAMLTFERQVPEHGSEASGDPSSTSCGDPGVEYTPPRIPQTPSTPSSSDDVSSCFARAAFSDSAVLPANAANFLVTEGLGEQAFVTSQKKLLPFAVRASFLIIASKALIAQLLSVLTSWSIAFLLSMKASTLQAMLVENFLEHSHGVVMFLLLCSLYDTPWSWALRALRRRRDFSVRQRRNSRLLPISASDPVMLSALNASDPCLLSGS